MQPIQLKSKEKLIVGFNFKEIKSYAIVFMEIFKIFLRF